MKKLIVYEIVFLILMLSVLAIQVDPATGNQSCDYAVNYNFTDLLVTSNTTMCGDHYNIRNFILNSDVTIQLVQLHNATYCNATSYTCGGWLKINASFIAVYGTIQGDGVGGGGGAGGGGGGASEPYNSGYGVGGVGGTAVAAFGYSGVTGSSGPSSPHGGDGGVGGTGFNSSSLGTQGYGGYRLGGGPGNDGGGGSSNLDTSVAINATYGSGGSGGSGGGGGGGFYNAAGGWYYYSSGGGGGGMGGSGGGYLILIAKKYLVSNGTYYFRDGQSYCAGNNAERGYGADGGAGASGLIGNYNCLRGSGALASDYSIAHYGSGYGGTGGYGAGGSVVFAAPSVELTGANVYTAGGSSNGGTIKVLYKDSALNGTYAAGYSTIVYSNISETSFTPGRYGYLASGNWTNTADIYNITNLYDQNFSTASKPANATPATLEIYVRKPFISTGVVFSAEINSTRVNMTVPTSCFNWDSAFDSIYILVSGMKNPSNYTMNVSCANNTGGPTFALMYNITTTNALYFNDSLLYWNVSIPASTVYTQPIYKGVVYGNSYINYSFTRNDTNMTIGNYNYSYVTLQYNGTINITNMTNNYTATCVDDPVGSHTCKIPITFYATTTGLNITLFNLNISSPETFGTTNETTITTIAPGQTIYVYMKAAYANSGIGRILNVIWTATK